MTPSEARVYRAGLEAAAGIVSEARFGERDQDLRSIAAAIRSLPVPEAEAGEDEAALMAAITAYKRERYGKWWPNGDTTEGVRDMELRAMQAALHAARGEP